MQIELRKMLAGIANQLNMADDILIGGSVKEHDKALEEVCRVLGLHGITLNPKKCVFDVSEVTFMGLVFNANGVKPDAKQVKKNREAKAPRNQAEIRSFLGMAGFSMRFIHDYANVVHPLRALLKEKKWNWNEECEAAFSKLKSCLTEQTLLHHYVPGKETELVVDASQKGLGAVLLQKGRKSEPFHVVSYRSRALKEVETRYSTTEREALAIRWGVKKMRQLLLGAPRFKVVTDHKPLTYMFNKVTGDLPPRIERCVMDIQEFDYVVEHRPGKDCIADYMSRNHADRTRSSPVKTQERSAKRVMRSEMCQAINEESAITLEDVKEATASCQLSSKIKEMIKTESKSSDPGLEPFSRIREQLSVIGGIICKGNQVVIPPSLQRKAVRLCHKAHQGMSKSKSFARSFCWFPGIDNMIEQKVKKCRQCQAVQDDNLEQPIKPRILPDGPWQQLEMDFQGPYPTGQYIFVVIDRHTRWPEVKILKRAPDAKMTMDAMEGIFRNKGVPEVCQSDNGPPFQSKEMSDFAKKHGYVHKHITPEWPRANGMVERFNRSMKEAIQAAVIEGKRFQGLQMSSWRCIEPLPIQLLG